MTARVRNIKVYPQFGGEICQGQAAEMKVCNNQTCPSEDNLKIEILTQTIKIDCKKKLFES